MQQTSGSFDHSFYRIIAPDHFSITSLAISVRFATAKYVPIMPSSFSRQYQRECQANIPLECFWCPLPTKRVQALARRMRPLRKRWLQPPPIRLRSDQRSILYPGYVLFSSPMIHREGRNTPGCSNKINIPRQSRGFFIDG